MKSVQRNLRCGLTSRKFLDQRLTIMPEGIKGVCKPLLGAREKFRTITMYMMGADLGRTIRVGKTFSGV